MKRANKPHQNLNTPFPELEIFMPRIRTHAIDLETVKRASQTITQGLMDLFKIPEDYVSLQVCQDVFIVNGQPSQGLPFVEVALFPRGPELEAAMARLITKALQDAGCPHLDLVILPLEPKGYFEDGEAFG